MDPAVKDYDTKDTVQELADEFYSRYLLKERKRPDISKQILDADIVPALGHKKLLELKPRDIIKALDPIVDWGTSCPRSWRPTTHTNGWMNGARP